MECPPQQIVIGDFTANVNYAACAERLSPCGDNRKWRMAEERPASAGKPVTPPHHPSPNQERSSSRSL